MKKLTAILCSISLCALISMLATSPAQAHIEECIWLPPYLDKDGVVIYRDGSSVDLLVLVKNDWYPDGLNVSKVIVSFDWGQNKTLDLSTEIEQVGWQETEIFTVSFTADAAEAVSSDWAHEYTIYVEHVNATTGPTEIVGTWDRERPWGWPLFVVFPTDQADADDYCEECYKYENDYPAWSFSNVNASQLAGQASIETFLGDTQRTHGEYASAVAHYQDALELYSQALEAEMEWGTKVDEAELDIALTEADANMATANAALRQADAGMYQSFSWILFGLGFVFMGVATIVYARRKPMAG